MRKPVIHDDFCECPECEAKYNKPNKTCIVFDIETCPQDEERLIALAPTFEPDSRLKDPDKIKANLEKQKANYIERAALDWKTANIVLIGIGDGKAYAPIQGNEADVLKSFFDIVKTSIANEVPFGGHNVKGFDFPMIVNRARALRVNIPNGILSFFKGRAYWSEFVFDTLEMFSFGDRQRIEGNGVEDICRALGIKGKLGDGAAFPALWKSDKEGAIAYNRQDVTVEIEIAKVCGLKFN